jgi:hypothetical protein
MNWRTDSATREGGSEWEPIKILLQRENSAYAPNSQPRIPTRVCQGRVVTTDLPTLETNPNSVQYRSTNQKAKDISNLESTRRTARSVRADCPRGGHRPSENATRTSSTAPRKTDRPWWTRGPSASSRTVRHSSTDRPQTSCTKNPPTKRIERKVLKNSHEHKEQPGCQAPRGQSVTTLRTVRGDLADGPPGANQHSRGTWETTSNYRLTDLPNHKESWDEILGRCWAP